MPSVFRKTLTLNVRVSGVLNMDKRFSYLSKPSLPCPYRFYMPLCRLLHLHSWKLYLDSRLHWPSRLQSLLSLHRCRCS